MITIGVDDIDAALRFYRDGLGFPTEGIIGTEFEHGAVVLFDLQPGLRRSLWTGRSIARDTGLGLSPGSPTDLTPWHNVALRAEVDTVMRRGAKDQAEDGNTDQKLRYSHADACIAQVQCERQGTLVTSI